MGFMKPGRSSREIERLSSAVAFELCTYIPKYKSRLKFRVLDLPSGSFKSECLVNKLNDIGSRCQSELTLIPKRLVPRPNELSTWIVSLIM